MIFLSFNFSDDDKYGEKETTDAYHSCGLHLTTHSKNFL